jgi:hypothetical protein
VVSRKYQALPKSQGLPINTPTRLEGCRRAASTPTSASALDGLGGWQ